MCDPFQAQSGRKLDQWVVLICCLIQNQKFEIKKQSQGHFLIFSDKSWMAKRQNHASPE